MEDFDQGGAADAVAAGFSTEPASIPDLIRQLKARYGHCITGELVLPARKGDYRELPPSLDARLAQALKARGIERLYSHQLHAWQQIEQGRDCVIVTPTASGKSLCYNLPVMQQAISAGSKALYLFPTKALSQDQVAEVNDLNQAGGLGLRAFTFDGDTPGDARKAVRSRGDIVVTNPDMLHQGILPHHTKWAQFFEQLRYVVIDEMHIYRGVFGSHVANVLRRLQRICRFYQARPVFILCSATIANPAQLAADLTGREVRLIERNGAPQGRKHLLLWNPPVVNPDLGIRASARSQTSRIARRAMENGFKTIVFAQSRLMVEVLTKYLKDRFDRDPRRAPRVKAYRGGYLPTERRSTEAALRCGDVDCVVSTSALELGVDIGALDVCILNGYPGTVAGSWQRLGRAGRRQRAAAGILVANSSPLDQFMVQNPEFFLSASPEHARIDADQLLILLEHIRCAAFELPFSDGETFGIQALQPFLEYLQQENVLHHEAGNWHWMADSYPANNVSLRSVADGNFLVIDITNGQQNIIAEVDYTAAPMTIYEGAIYLIQAKPWQVERLDWEGRKAFVTATRADYYTDAIDYSKLKVLEHFARDERDQVSFGHGEVHLVRRISGYKKIRYYSHENIGFGPIKLPDQEMHTTAAWWRAHTRSLEKLFANRWQAIDGFLGAAHAMHFVAALLSMTEPRDLGRAVGNADATWFATVDTQGRGNARKLNGDAAALERTAFQPTVFLYDNFPGGMGLAAPLFELRERIVRDAASMIQQCSCEQGCPSCVGPILRRQENGRDIDAKQSALAVLKLFSAGH